MPRDIENLRAWQEQNRKAHFDADPDYYRNKSRRWRAKYPVRYMVSQARVRCRREGIPCTITEEDVDFPEFCPVFPEIRLEFSGLKNRRPDNTPALDRLIPALGYVPGNVRVISMLANRKKQDSSAAELRRIADWIDGELVDFDPLAAILG